MVADLRALGARVLVVDDGSRDCSGDRARAAGARVHRLSRNRGKGHALRRGFALLASAGARRVLTCDADGQHRRDDCLRLARTPVGAADLVVGCRDMTPAPRLNRLGGRLCDRVVGSLGVPPGIDSQSGLRIYPLPEVLRLESRGSRYHYEVEVLVHAVRRGIEVRGIPVGVRYPRRRRTHFRRLGDTWRTVAALARCRTRAPGRAC